MEGACVRLELPLPPSVNRLYGLRRGEFTKRTGADYTAEVIVAVNALPPAQRVLAAPYRLDVVFHFPHKRHDLDNPLKALIDALAHALGWDDRDLGELHAFKRLDPAHPRCTLWLRSARLRLEQ